MKPIVNFSAVSKSFSQKMVFMDLNLSIEPGSLNILHGPNGCGKSTLFYLMSGLLKRTAGEISVMGITDPLKYNTLVSYVLSRDMLYSNRSVKFNITLVSALYGIPKNNFYNELEYFEILGIKNQELSKLSSGTKQKFDLALAFARNTKILVMDEPTNHLDIDTLGLFIERLDSGIMNGKTVLLASHSLEHFSSIDHNTYNMHNISKEN
jgi:ABC-2 type transport system ATP-binding protein